MTSRSLALVILLAGCFDDVPVVETSGMADTAIETPIPTEATEDLATYRWEVVEAVEGSFVGGTKVDTPRTDLRFDRRGQYVIDRWILSGLSERLTHHVLVTVTGKPPTAEIALNGPSFVAVGATTRFDGSLSASFEKRMLTYRWQLVMRPAASQASLPVAEIEAPTVSLVPDVAGTYGVQLRAFDGELWSEPAARFIEVYAGTP